MIGSEYQISDYFTGEYSQCIPKNLLVIFNIAMKDKELFPNLNLANGSTYKDYIDRWVQNYRNAENNQTRTKIALPKGSCDDPAIRAIVKMVTGVTDEEVTLQETHHRLFMSAENIQGALLEEYIDSVIHEHGWIWCKGNVLKAVDFCTTNGVHLLQIKNKSNTENSSSSSIRSGTTIKKWYRLGTKQINGEKLPDYKWNLLVEYIENISKKECRLSEVDYINYIEEVIVNNPKIITDL